MPTTIPEDGESDWIVIRYADVLLMLAEAQHELGKTAEAVAHLNQVRIRAGMPAFMPTTTSALAEAIAQERRLELIGEGHRWFDLLRTDKAIETMNRWFQTQTNLGISIDEHNLLMPIPQSQINTDPSLIQNPGY